VQKLPGLSFWEISVASVAAWWNNAAVRFRTTPERDAVNSQKPGSHDRAFLFPEISCQTFPLGANMP
jgi:hypothetical protein